MRPLFLFFLPFIPPLFFLFLFLGSCSSFLSFSFSFSSFFKKNYFFVFSFLAYVSGFNKRCFLRSRCSMEMWCPDDIGQDSWIGLGRLLGGEHASTPQSGVEAPRLLKRSLPGCIIVVVLEAKFTRVPVHTWKNLRRGLDKPLIDATTGGLTRGRNSRRQRHPRNGTQPLTRVSEKGRKERRKPLIAATSPQTPP